MVMDGLPPILHVLWMHVKGFTRLGCSPCMRGFPPSGPHTAKATAKDFTGSVNHQAIHGEKWDVIQGISGHGCVATCSTCLVDIWTIADSPGKQSTYCDASHPSKIAPKMWDLISKDIQNHHDILVVVCVIT